MKSSNARGLAANGLPPSRTSATTCACRAAASSIFVPGGSRSHFCFPLTRTWKPYTVPRFVLNL